VVEVPSGTHVSAIEDIESLIGRRAEQNILHPLNGRVLVEADKLITRSMISQLKTRDRKWRVSCSPAKLKYKFY